MKLSLARLTPKTPAGVITLALVLSSSACIDNVKPVDPLSEEQNPLTGQSIEVVPDVAELPRIGDQVRLEAAVRDSRGRLIPGARVTWQAGDPRIATVDATGNVTGVGQGMTEVRGTNGNLSSVAVIAVAKPPNHSTGNTKTTVAISPDSATVPTVGGTIKLLAVGRNAGGHLVSGNKMDWGTTDPSVATVADGVVTGKSSGEAKIIVVNGGAADTADVAVAPPGTPASVVVTPANDTIPTIGGSVSLTGQVLNGAGTVLGYGVAWSSLDPSIASVAGGRVTGLAKGVARIRATYDALADTARIWVGQTATATSIFVLPKVDTIPDIGGTTQIQATALDGNGVEIEGAVVSWNSVDPSVATVDGTGTVKGISKGSARILARIGTLVDTATVVVAPAIPTGEPATIRITPQVDTIATLGSWAFLAATAVDAQGNAVDVVPVWTSLDPGVAYVGEYGNVKAMATGTAHIVAAFGGLADTAMVYVAPTGTTGSPSVRIVPDTSVIQTVGSKVNLAWIIKDAQGNTLVAEPTWASLDPALVSVNADGGVTGLAKGTGRVTATWSGVADTAAVLVAPSGTGSGTGQFYITPQADTITVGGVRPLQAWYSGGATVDVTTTASWNSLDPSIAGVGSGGLVTGYASGTARITATYNGAVDTARITVKPAIPIPTGGSSLTPGSLVPALGELTGMGSSSNTTVASYDSRYLAAEWNWWQKYLAGESDMNVVVVSNHYGTLRSRLQWAIRNGQSYGPSATDESTQVYARGRRMLRRYLQWSKSNGYVIQPHNNTGLPDVEALYVLEGDKEALDHINVFAAFSSYVRVSSNYLQLGQQNTDIRWMYEALQAFSAMARLGVPHAPAAANPQFPVDGSLPSWAAEGNAVIAGIASSIASDGSLPTISEGGRENLLFNAMLAAELFKWDSYVSSSPTAYNLAKQVMNHILVAWESLGRQILPYQYLGGASTTPAPDLAAYYVWPSLVMWQETGDARFRDMAMIHLDGTRNAWIDGAVKQFNQVYSTGAQNAEALLSGISWR